MAFDDPHFYPCHYQNELDITESFYPGEGNGNPLQYSCLENPMEGGAWPGGHKRVGLSDLGQLSD